MRGPYEPFVGAKLAKLTEHAEAMRLHAQPPIDESRALTEQLGELNYSIASPEPLPRASGDRRGLRPAAGIDPDRLAHLKTEATKLEAAIEQRVDEHRRRHELYLIASHVLNISRDWLARLPEGTVLNRAPIRKLENGDYRKRSTSSAAKSPRRRPAQGGAGRRHPPRRTGQGRPTQWVATRRLRHASWWRPARALRVFFTRARDHPLDRCPADPISLMGKLFRADGRPDPRRYGSCARPRRRVSDASVPRSWPS